MNTKLLEICGAQIRSEDDDYEFEKISVNFGPRIILDPHAGVTIQELQDSIKGKIQIINNSTLVLRGKVKLQNLYLEGILKLEASGVFKNIIVRNKIVHKFIPVDVSDPKLPSYLKIRGYNITEGRHSTDLSNCKVSGHERYPIVAINISKESTGGSRLVCPKCMCEEQSQTASKCVFIRDLMCQKDQKVKGWANESINNKI